MTTDTLDTNMARSYLPTTNGITTKQKEKRKGNPNGKMRKATKEK